MAQDAQLIHDLLLEFWNTGNQQLANQIYTSSSERHAPDHTARGTQEIVNYVTQTRAGFPDFKLERKEILSDSDRFAVHWKASGTHKGEFMGIPGTGKWVEIHGLSVGRIRDGHITEEFVYFDRLRLLEQLGIAPTQDDVISARR
jgi:steroid delta-isomerase-like uncharacterized protein